MSSKARSGSSAPKRRSPGQDQKRPIARTMFELDANEMFRVWSDALLAHLEYCKSGTVHGNINPDVLFADSRTGRGFLADYEHSTNVVAPHSYIPLAVSMNALEHPGTAKAFYEMREKETRRKENLARGSEEREEATRTGEQLEPEQGPPFIIPFPLTHGYEVEDPLVPPTDRTAMVIDEKV